LGNLSTPKTVQKLQKALHAKEGDRLSLYALYDKISRDDICTRYAQCRSKRRTGGDGQDFRDIETYGVERWLGELALGAPGGETTNRILSESVHPEGQRQVRPWASRPVRGSGLHDSSELVLEPIFEADLPPEQ